MFTCSWSAVHFQKVLLEGKYLKVKIFLLTHFTLSKILSRVCVCVLIIIEVQVVVEIEGNGDR